MSLRGATSTMSKVVAGALLTAVLVLAVIFAIQQRAMREHAHRADSLAGAVADLARRESERAVLARQRDAESERRRRALRAAYVAESLAAETMEVAFDSTRRVLAALRQAAPGASILLAALDTSVAREQRACGLLVATCRVIQDSLRAQLRSDSTGRAASDSSGREARELLGISQRALAVERRRTGRRWGLGVTVGCGAALGGGKVLAGCPAGAAGLTRLF